jgi:hypothetical protein
MTPNMSPVKEPPDITAELEDFAIALKVWLRSKQRLFS